MFEYTNAFLSPYKWAKKIYDVNLEIISAPEKVDATLGTLISPVHPTLNLSEVTIRTDSDWNSNSKNLIATVGASYKTQDQASSYIDSLYTTISSRLGESERRVKELENSLKVLTNYQQRGASTGINIRGGDFTSIDFDKKFYKTSPPLATNLEEGVFKLRDSGFFSSIRSLGGFAGTAVVEKSLLNYVENGYLSSITDGSRDSFWTATAYVPGPVKSGTSQIPWLPSDYNYGFALLFSYYIDRPTLATEVFIDPIITEPLDVLSISWAPESQTNLISSLMAASSGWTTSGNSSFIIGGSFGSSSVLVNLNSGGSGWASYGFTVPTITNTVSGSAVNASNRAQLSYYCKGLGDIQIGARIYWYNASGQVINYSRNENSPPAFWTNRTHLDYVPTNAVSGRVDLGAFNNYSGPCSGYLDYPILYIGDEVFNCNVKIDGPTTIQLPKPVLSSRFTFTVSQRNTRREVLSKTTNNTLQPLVPDIELDATLQKMVDKVAYSFSSPGNGNSTFSYRIGFKEVDIRYREHVPRGSLISLPLITSREIRNIWVTTELGKFFDSGVSFKIYPFANDLTQSLAIKPWKISTSVNTSDATNGDYLYIYSSEEIEAGWYNPEDNYFTAPEKQISDQFNGTDRNGRVKLLNAPHLRRPTIKAQLDWLERYSVWPAILDPNAETVYGFSSSTLKDAIRSNSIPSGTVITDVVNNKGYLPIKVTIETDKWTAYPDTLGRPDVSKVRQITGESLIDISSSSETQVSEVQQDTASFENWLNTTTSLQLSNLVGGLFEGHGLSSSLSKIFRVYASNNSTRTLSTLLLHKGSHGPFKATNKDKDQLKSLFDKLVASGKVSLDSTKTITSLYVIPANSVYSTKFAPIISGPGGVFLKLFWWNPSASGGYLPIARGDYEVLDAKTGRVKVLKSAPTSGYTDIVADYLYISDSSTEDFFSTVLGSINTASANVTAITSQANVTTRSFPITRNMTDYITGKVPTLRPPNFIRLSADYYPIIEYYVNSDGELIFSRDFYRYGDIPANIKVDYETLGVSPRVGIEVTRQGTIATSPILKSVALRVKESMSSPIRETE